MERGGRGYKKKSRKKKKKVLREESVKKERRREKEREKDLPVLDGVGKLEYTSLYLSLISNVDLLVVSSNHGGLDLGSSDDGRENRSRSIISGETSLYHTGSVINNESSFFIFFSHFELLFFLFNRFGECFEFENFLCDVKSDVKSKRFYFLFCGVGVWDLSHWTLTDLPDAIVYFLRLYTSMSVYCQAESYAILF